MGESENTSVAPANVTENELHKTDEKEPVVLATKVCGVVKWFSVRHGYGFISTPSSNDDVFVHSRKIKINNPRKLYKTLAEGETVEFDIVEGGKGHEAINVTGPDGGYVQGSQFAANRTRYADDRYWISKKKLRARQRKQGQQAIRDQESQRRPKNRRRSRRGKSGSSKEGDAPPKDSQDKSTEEGNDKTESKSKSEENKS